MNGEFTIESWLQFKNARHGRRQLTSAHVDPDVVEAIPGRVPRIARLMALAIRFDRLLREGKVKDFADIARLGHVTRARATQIMNLMHLAPDIQEQILFLPRLDSGRDPVKEWQVRPVAATPDWGKQRRMWREVSASTAEANR
jgi:hypothetical protein